MKWVLVNKKKNKLNDDSFNHRKLKNIVLKAQMICCLMYSIVEWERIEANKFRPGPFPDSKQQMLKHYIIDI